MPTTVIGLCDPHFTDKSVRSRKDSLAEVQFEKLHWVRELCHNTPGCAALVIAGDLFHQPDGQRIKRWLDLRLIDELRQFSVPVYTIWGNHDLHRHESNAVINHPAGVLLKAGVVESVHYPEQRVVGTDPQVLITGLDYQPEGPLSWLQNLRETQALFQRKAQTGAEFVLALTHCFWGVETGICFGEPQVGYPELSGTGVDVCLFGHPHTDDGVVNCQGVQISGPGAMLRGTLAEKDVLRQPCVSVMTFTSNQKPRVEHVPIPCRPAEDVFDYAKHLQSKREDAHRLRFIEALQNGEFFTRTTELEPDRLLEECQRLVSQDCLPEALSLVRQYLTEAESGGTR